MYSEGRSSTKDAVRFVFCKLSFITQSQISVIIGDKVCDFFRAFVTLRRRHGNF